MPVVFVGHGSPMNAIEDNEFSREWTKIGQELPRPKAIVVISAHWMDDGTLVTGNGVPEKINDFYGFPKELYEKEYPAKGDVELAKRVEELTGAKLNNNWGIDHGTWSVLCRMYPEADVPVIQLSLDNNKTPQEHWEVAKKLASLREEGILIMGSGNVVHNLGMVQWTDQGFEWAIEFDKKIKELIIKNDFDKLINYEELENWEKAIPTNEHYLPSLYVLTLKHKEEKVDFRCEKVIMGSMSMRSWIIAG